MSYTPASDFEESSCETLERYCADVVASPFDRLEQDAFFRLVLEQVSDDCACEYTGELLSFGHKSYAIQRLVDACRFIGDHGAFLSGGSRDDLLEILFVQNWWRHVWNMNEQYLIGAVLVTHKPDDTLEYINDAVQHTVRELTGNDFTYPESSYQTTVAQLLFGQAWAALCLSDTEETFASVYRSLKSTTPRFTFEDHDKTISQEVLSRLPNDLSW